MVKTINETYYHIYDKEDKLYGTASHELMETLKENLIQKGHSGKWVTYFPSNSDINHPDKKYLLVLDDHLLDMDEVKMLENKGHCVKPILPENIRAFHEQQEKWSSMATQF